MQPPADGKTLPVLTVKLNQAVAFHGRGQLAQAQALYEEILRSQPRHFAALHLLGLLAAAAGELPRAVELIGRALAIEPDNAIAHNNLGAALRDWGRPEAALASVDRAIALKGDYAEPHFNRGNLLADLGRPDDALHSYTRAISLRGDLPQAYFQRGNILKDLHRWREALSDYDHAVDLKDDYAEAQCNRGIVLAALKRLPAALASYDRAIALDAGLAAAHYNRANALCELRRWEEAIDGYDRAIELQPDYAEAHANRGFAQHELERPDEALASLDRAIAIKSDHAEAHCNRGGVLVAMRRLDEALESYERAVALRPDLASGYVNRGLTRLLRGEYPEGWADHEWRRKDERNWIVEERRDFSQPLWLGQSDLSGRTILLQSEQGYGDTLQFCRYVRLVARRGGTVILEVPAALASLLECLADVCRIIVQGEPLPPFDCFCPLLSLPLAMNTTLSSIPDTVPYLASSEERLRHWRRKVGVRSLPRVGLVWSSGSRPSRPDLESANSRRNVPLASFAALKGLDVEFYSLQKGQPAESELATLVARRWDGPRIVDLSGEIRDFADTAALIGQLDLVISVDTATAHLAGALGSPVWVLLRFGACWRWLLERSDSPWYPTARLYRQERPGDWHRVLARVRSDLAQEFANGTRSRATASTTLSQSPGRGCR